MILSPSLMYFVVFTICLLWPNRAAGSANASFSHLPVNVLKEVSSYQSEAESAKVFRFINRKCDEGHRQQVIAKVDQFKSLLEGIQEESLEDAQFTAQRIIALFHDLKLSGLFAFESPRILQQWIAEMQIKHLDAIPLGIRDLLQSTITSMIPQVNRKNFVQIHPGSPDLIGPQYDNLKHLVENKGLILIHPSHCKSVLTLKVVNDEVFRYQIRQNVKDRIKKLIKYSGIVIACDDDVNILLMLKSIENGGRCGSDEMDRILYWTVHKGSGRMIFKAFNMLMQRDVALFSEALRKVAMRNEERYFQNFGTAIDIVTLQQPTPGTLRTKWSAILSEIALNWINGNRREAKTLIWDMCHMYYRDSEGRMNRGNLIKIQEVFPWLMPDDLMDALLKGEAEFEDVMRHAVI